MIALGLAALVVGGLTGAATSALLYGLTWATATRENSSWLLWLLAPAGALIGYLYQTYGRLTEAGNALIIDEIHRPTRAVPFRMAPLILFSTILTHLVGGSAGREGSAVQMGGALAERVARTWQLVGDRRRTLLTSGLAAGFAAAIGAPLAGTLFGLEVLAVGGWRWRAFPFAAAAAFSATGISHLLKAPHTAYPPVPANLSSPAAWGWVLLGGLLFGLITRLFMWATHGVAAGFARLRWPPAMVPAAGGLLLSALFLGLGYQRYAGLGLDVIQASLKGPGDARDWILKLAFTALTLGAGFKGGEFIPLVFIGTTLGRVLEGYAGDVPLAALGFAAVFGAAAHTPLACAVMAAELFGLQILMPALLACAAADLCSGHPGIYSSQPKGLFASARVLGYRWAFTRSPR